MNYVNLFKSVSQLEMLMSQKLVVPFTLIFVVGFMLGVGVMFYFGKNFTHTVTITVTVTVTTTTTTTNYSSPALAIIAFISFIFLLIFLIFSILVFIREMRRDRWRVLWGALKRRALRVV
jgi:glucan phosphoethanolaminetransferase (alkaline phosphatase superfamily)